MNLFLSFCWTTVRNCRQSSIRLCVLALLLVLPAMMTGCLSRPALSKEHFLISPSAPPAADKPRFDDTLILRLVTVAPQFEARSLVYRMTDNSYESDAYAEFLIPPDRMVGSVVRHWLRGSGIFQDVAEPNTAVLATRLAELHISEFYGDFRSANEATAVFTMRFILFAKEAGPAKVSLAKVYSRNIRLKEKTARGVVQGLQEAVNQALTELSGDLAKAN